MPRCQSKSQTCGSQEDMLNMTGISKSQKNNSEDEALKSKMKPAEFKRKVGDMVRHILFADKKKVPIKRADLIKNVMKEHSKEFAKVFLEASEQIKKIFGFEVVRLESDGKIKGYILVNTLECTDEDMFAWDGEGEKMGLLIIILSMIFMNEGVLSEASLWYILKKFAIHKDRSHKVFGDVDKLINQEFTKQSYLERKRVLGPEGPTYQYHFGARSTKEISKRKILEFVTEIYGADSIKSWKMQYLEVLDEERPPDVEMTQN